MSNSAIIANDIQPLSPREFKQVRDLLYDTSGLDLRAGKESLVFARLGKKIREARCRSFQEYFQGVISDRTGESLTKLIDALTTNYTSFFREPAHFEFLRSVIVPQWREHHSIRIWSAACATGEEPYSVAFCLKDAFGTLDKDRIRILATDISTGALATARKAVYPADALHALPEDRLGQYVLRGAGRWKGWYRVREDVRAPITFERLNLMEPISQRGPFALIFCRNVMIYFDKATQAALTVRLAERLEPGGYLFIGHAETLNGIDHPLEYVKPAVYRNPEGNSSRKRGRVK